MDSFAKYREKLNFLDVLYVEDDNNLRSSTRQFFMKFFKSVDSCKNGKEALIKYNTKFYDIIITDISMPVMNGLEMAEKIREINPDQVIIIVSSYNDDSYFIKSVEIGIDGYILKPFSIEQILNNVIRISQKIYLNKELQEYSNKLEEIVEERTEEIVEKGMHDQLTGTYNYFGLLELLRETKKVNVILFDIDHFSSINDAYGFEIGDEVLVESVRYLELIKPLNSKLFRLNSDEFVLVIEDEISETELISVLDSILSFFSESEIALSNGINIKVSFSMGVAVGSDISVLNKAKTAVRELRVYKRGSYKFFDRDSKFLRQQKDNIDWIHKIKDSITNGKLVAYYHPIINNATGKIEKYEALARIVEDDAMIPPIRFMEAAKITGMLPSITKTMIKQSCETFSQNDYEFSINITGEDLYMGYLEEFLLRSTSRNNIKTSRVVLEILEDITSLNHMNCVEQLNSLRKRGFKIAIDDFGSQSSNLSRLLDFNPDYLKIDGSFIKNILNDEKSHVITEAIVLLSHKRGIKVIAEFVHSAEVFKKVKELGIDFSQGYYFNEPKQELAHLLSN